jgi:hypothetical protein
MEVIMSCPLCRSSNEAELATEMVIHFSGLENLDKPGVWVFSRLLVCLDCGGSLLNIPERELAAITKSILANTSSTLKESAGDVAFRRGAASQVGS